MSELLTRVRRTPDRLLHPLRRRKALEALRVRSRPAAVLVVCHGNICRSPVAAALLERALEPLGIRVDSAGFVGPDRPPPADAVSAALRRGVNLSTHRSRLLTPVLTRAADLILVMEPRQQQDVVERFGRARRDVIILGDLDPQSIQTRSIRDPLEQGLSAFEESYARIERCVNALAAALQPASSTAIHESR